MTDKVVVACSCGKKYKLPQEKLGRTMKCRDCGSSFLAQAEEEAVAPALVAAPEPAAQPALTHFDIESLDISRPVDPDRLIEPLQRTTIMPLVGISVGIHVVLIALASIRYFTLVPEYGWIDPEGKQQAAIREQEEEKKRKEREAARKQRMEELAKKKEEEEKKKKEEQEKKAAENQGAAGTTKSGEGGGAQKNPYEDQKSFEKPASTNPLELE